MEDATQRVKSEFQQHVQHNIFGSKDQSHREHFQSQKILTCGMGEFLSSPPPRKFPRSSCHLAKTCFADGPTGVLLASGSDPEMGALHAGNFPAEFEHVTAQAAQIRLIRAEPHCRRRWAHCRPGAERMHACDLARRILVFLAMELSLTSKIGHLVSLLYALVTCTYSAHVKESILF